MKTHPTLFFTLLCFLFSFVFMARLYAQDNALPAATVEPSLSQPAMNQAQPAGEEIVTIGLVPEEKEEKKSRYHHFGF